MSDEEYRTTTKTTPYVGRRKSFKHFIQWERYLALRSSHQIEKKLCESETPQYHFQHVRDTAHYIRSITTIATTGMHPYQSTIGTLPINGEQMFYRTYLLIVLWFSVHALALCSRRSRLESHP
jgi:hypothetical protein